MDQSLLSPRFTMVRRCPAWREAAVGLLVVLALAPLLGAVVGSFRDGAALAEYGRWWGTDRGWEALWRTAALAGAAALLAVAMAAVLTAAASRFGRRTAMLIAVAACVPLVIPSSLIGTAWIAMLGRQGALYPVARALFGEHFSVYSFLGAAGALASRYVGLATLLLVHERLRRRGTWPAEQVFDIPVLARVRDVHLRGALRSAVVAWLLVLLFAMNDHVLPEMLLQSTYGTQVLSELEAMQNPAGAAALALPMALLSGAIIAGVVLSGRRIVTSAEPPADGIAPPSLRWQKTVAVAVVTVVFLAAFGVPLVILVRQAGSLVALVKAFGSAWPQVVQTLRVAAIAGLLCTLLAVVMAGHWVDCRRRRRATLVPLVLLNLAVPPSLLGIGMITLTNRWPAAMIAGTAWPMIAATVARFLPVAVLVLFAAWRQESPLEPLAARVHGVSRWRTAWQVQWPRRRTMVLATMTLAALLVVTELEVSILLAPPGGSTLGVRLRSMIHTAPPAMFAALAVDTVLLIVPGIIVAALLLHRGRKTRREDA
jgi:ABC-type Fe3+ transport system permease subunit